MLKKNHKIVTIYVSYANFGASSCAERNVELYIYIY